MLFKDMLIKEGKKVIEMIDRGDLDFSVPLIVHFLLGNIKSSKHLDTVLLGIVKQNK